MARIDVDGLDELQSMLFKMTITLEDERKVMREALEPVKKQVEANTPVYTGESKASIRVTVQKDGYATIGIVRIHKKSIRHQEYGTSRQNKNVGFFARAITASKDEALKLIKEGALRRVK